MESIVGVFKSRQSAEEAVNGLRAAGFASDCISFVTPERTEEGLASVPTTDAELPGIGKTISGYVGGVIGGGVGLGVGSAIASLIVPGVGPVLAAGIGAGALLGIGGAAVGASLGESTEKELDVGVPHDDVRFYRQLLKQGRSLVVVEADGEESAAAARGVLHKHGSEDVGAARKEWDAQRSDRAA